MLWKCIQGAASRAIPPRMHPQVERHLAECVNSPRKVVCCLLNERMCQVLTLRMQTLFYSPAVTGKEEASQNISLLKQFSSSPHSLWLERKPISKSDINSVSFDVIFENLLKNTPRWFHFAAALQVSRETHTATPASWKLLFFFKKKVLLKKWILLYYLENLAQNWNRRTCKCVCPQRCQPCDFRQTQPLANSQAHELCGTKGTKYNPTVWTSTHRVYIAHKILTQNRQ